MCENLDTDSITVFVKQEIMCLFPLSCYKELVDFLSLSGIICAKADGPTGKKRAKVNPYY